MEIGTLRPIDEKFKREFGDVIRSGPATVIAES